MQIIHLLIAATLGGVIVWLLGLIVLRQKYQLENDAIRNESDATVTSLKDKLDIATQRSEEQQIFVEQYREAYEDERELSIQYKQKNLIYEERMEGLHSYIFELEKTKERYQSLQTTCQEMKLELSNSLSDTQSTLKERDANYNLLYEQWSRDQLKIDTLQAQLANTQSKLKELETRMEAEQKISKEKVELLEQNKQELKLEFKELANRILKSNSQEFSTQNSQNLTAMINPIKEQFEAFKKQINDVYIKETKERSALQAELSNIKEINLQMSKEANNLTNALKGESKTQGIWGEMILERVLENSGLQEGESYKREVSLEHSADGSRYRPDVIVYLPDNREIIIDAKTSLSAYEQYISSENEHFKKKFADQHIASIKRHIKELHQKDYSGLKGVETLDFVFMFIPIESALLMAMEYDSTLFDFAFKKNVILVAPTTLMVALRAVENSWRYEHQQKNAIEIAQRSGLLFDKFVGFIESVDKLGKQLGTLQRTYDDTYSKLHTGSGSITSQFQKLEKLGAAASKKLSKQHLNEIEE